MAIATDEGPDTESWRFWVDRGGTFTDVIGVHPSKGVRVEKLLSAQPHRDAVVLGIRRILGVPPGESLPTASVGDVRIGTTVATNALLERTGAPTALVITRGFGDLLRIGYQTRPDLFALDIDQPAPLYDRVVEITERLDASGRVVIALDENRARVDLAAALEAGCRSAAIVLLHAYAHPDHERRLAAIARWVGFDHVSVSHEVSPLIKAVPRGQTTVIDAYLTPGLRRYVDDVTAELGVADVRFMQSNGGVATADEFQGRNALLSGPAGGVVGMSTTGMAAGRQRLIGFDMGGTSTDVSHFAGILERVTETTVAGTPVQVPMLEIHTVAAGGGSVVHIEHGRLRVGPHSAGADPGPACYGRGGPATITDANVVLGRVAADHLPRAFGADGRQPIDVSASRSACERLAAQLGTDWSAEAVAAGAVEVAVEHMATAIRQISVARGHDLRAYTLVCFGGAGAQHACDVADRLGITEILIHPLAGVLSALGVGLSDERWVHRQWSGRPLDDAGMADAQRLSAAVDAPGGADVTVQLGVRLPGSDETLSVPWGSLASVREAFSTRHRERFGFVADADDLVIEYVETEAVRPADVPAVVLTSAFDRVAVDGPVILATATTTVVITDGWRGQVDEAGNLVLGRAATPTAAVRAAAEPDPLQIELFDRRFMAVAEQMGTVLEQTAASVNIKERRDFSCAVFDADAQLVANAPHVPVHLGSMSEAVRAIRDQHADTWRPGDSFATNAPYHGGTHLPDITVVRPVFDERANVRFFVAARGHHADIGGIAPGSFPAHSRIIDEEGVVLAGVVVTRGDRFDDAGLRVALTAGPYPARAVDLNLADLRAQVAACWRGEQELRRLTDQFGIETVTTHMTHLLDNAEQAVRSALGRLEPGTFTCLTDDGAPIRVAVTIDPASGSATVDFTGTAEQHTGNFNAPQAVTRAAVLYVVRCLLNSTIALNDGCFRPLTLVVPQPSLLAPEPPGAVVAGNVETSQLVVDALFGALGVLAGSQGTMNNVVFGNDEYQYYETLAGGAGASAVTHGASAVHTHMTNSRLTDPEVVETRLPVRVVRFGIRSRSGGDGRHRGGDGLIRAIEFLEPMELNLVTGRRRVAPHGLAGGHPGAPGVNRIQRADGTTEPLDGVAATTVAPGDVLVVETPGGGGYGPPPAVAD